MKKIKLCSLLFSALLIRQVNAQGPTIEWAHSFGGSAQDRAECVQQTSDGGYVVAGFSNSTDGDLYSGNKGGYDAVVVKYYNSGGIQWRKNYGGSSHDEARSICQTSDGGYVVACATESNDGDVTGHHGGADIWIVRLNSNGTILWQKALGGSNSDVPHEVKQTTDGGFIIAGSTQSGNGDISNPQGWGDYWVVKLNSLGGIVWEKSLGGSSWDEARSIQQTTDGGYVVTGMAISQDGHISNHIGTGGNMWVVKLNSAGNIVWEKSFSNADGAIGESIQQTNDGGYIVAGSATETLELEPILVSTHDIFVVKLTTLGSTVWQKVIGGYETDLCYDIKQLSNGNYILAGSTESFDGDVQEIMRDGFNDYWIAELRSNGDVHWQASFGGPNNNRTFSDEAKSIQLTSDGGLIMTGYSALVPGNHGGEDFWTIKLEPFNTISKLVGDQCGEAVDLNGNFYFEPIAGATDYRLSIFNNGGSHYFQVRTSGGPNFIPKSAFTGLQYNRSYRTYVWVKVNGFWRGLSGFCLISTNQNAEWREIRGANSNVNPLALDIYPNPSNNDGFRVNLTNLKDENNQITILVYDMFGKQVHTEQFTHDRSDFTTRLNTDGSLSSGIYLVNVLVNGKAFNQKVKVE